MFTQFFNTLRKAPVLLDCNFTILQSDPTGITALKGPGIDQVFMHTTTTPAAGSPNPELGTAMIVLQDTYKQYLGGFNGFISPTIGSDLTTGLTIGKAYVITALGASTLAQFQTAGLPLGMTPTVGQAFVAKATSIAGGATLKAPGQSNIMSVEVVGDPSLTLTNYQVVRDGVGPYLIIRFMAPQALSFTATTATSTALTGIAPADIAKLRVGQLISGPGIADGTTIVSLSTTSAVLSLATTASATITAVAADVQLPVQPQDGSQCKLAFYLSNSSIRQKGE
mgnify:CR=1 FL=1